jgi:Chondroitinase B
MTTLLHRRRGVLSGAAALLAAGLSRPAAAAMVHDGRGLRAALRAARPGVVVVLAPGDYDDGRGPLALAADGVVLRAAAGAGAGIRTVDPRRPVLRVPLLVRGDATRLEGLAFADGAGEARRVLGPERLRISGSGVQVVDAEFFGTRGVAITITGSARNPLVRGCYFHDPLGDPGNPNLNAAIQVGLGAGTAYTRIGARIEDNLFERWRTEAETVSIKSSGNTVRGNRLVECLNLTNRYGEDNLYEDNTLDRSGWLTVFDRDNRVLGNQATTSSGLRVMAGDTPCGVARQGGQPQACDTLLEGNAGRLVIGFQFSGDQIRAEGTVVRSHRGQIELRAQQNTTLPGGLRPPSS